MKTPTAPADVHLLYLRLLEAWNERSPDDYAALFAEDGTAIGFDGSEIGGPDLAGHLRSIFADHATARYVAVVRRVQALGSDIALLISTAGMLTPDGQTVNPSLNAVHTMLAATRAGAWQIVLFQNTPAQYHGRPDLAEQHTNELQRSL
jgi:uncharacterized protein (TIGR02246 family)